MGEYRIKNLKIDMAEDSAEIHIVAQEGVHPVRVDLSFPFHCRASHSEGEARTLVLQKAQQVLSRALEAVR